MKFCFSVLMRQKILDQELQIIKRKYGLQILLDLDGISKVFGLHVLMDQTSTLLTDIQI